MLGRAFPINSAVALTLALTGLAAAEPEGPRVHLPPSVTPPLWTGFYVGVNAGYTRQSNSIATNANNIQFCNPLRNCPGRC
jgi:outer membrane immunogenic protein